MKARYRRGGGSDTPPALRAGFGIVRSAGRLRGATDLPLAVVAYRMFERWTQEKALAHLCTGSWL